MCLCQLCTEVDGIGSLDSLPIALSSSNVCVSIVKCKVSVFINGNIAVGYPVRVTFGVTPSARCLRRAMS